MRNSASLMARSSAVAQSCPATPPRDVRARAAACPARTRPLRRRDAAASSASPRRSAAPRSPRSHPRARPSAGATSSGGSRRDLALRRRGAGCSERALHHFRIVVPEHCAHRVRSRAPARSARTLRRPRTRRDRDRRARVDQQRATRGSADSRRPPRCDAGFGDRAHRRGAHLRVLVAEQPFERVERAGTSPAPERRGSGHAHRPRLRRRAPGAALRNGPRPAGCASAPTAARRTAGLGSCTSSAISVA